MPEFNPKISPKEAKNQSSPLPGFVPAAKVVPLFACGRSEPDLSCHDKWHKACNYPRA
jgi:hypothetical protein